MIGHRNFEDFRQYVSYRPALYLGLGGLLGGWQDPQGLLAVTLLGVAFVFPHVNVSAAPAIRTTAATLPRLWYEITGDLT
jgi:hypothetical protein